MGIPKDLLHRWRGFEVGLEDPDLFFSGGVDAPWCLQVFSTEVFCEPELEAWCGCDEDAGYLLGEKITEEEDEENYYGFGDDYLEEGGSCYLEGWTLAELGG